MWERRGSGFLYEQLDKWETVTETEIEKKYTFGKEHLQMTLIQSENQGLHFIWLDTFSVTLE